MKEKGYCWHTHHASLLEWCYDYDERAEYIRTEKPEHERETRLSLFKRVKGDLPEEVVKAGQEYDKAWQYYYKAVRSRVKERHYYKAMQFYNEALDRNKKLIEILHTKECPNCPWDGYTIFPR